MAILTKTVADFVTAWEAGGLEIAAALKKPGADRVVMAVRRWTEAGAFSEVWDVG